MKKIIKYMLIVIIFIFCISFAYSKLSLIATTNVSKTDSDPGITLLEITANESDDEISDLKDSKDEEEAAVDMYTKIGDIKGESTDEKDEDSGLGFGDGERGKRPPTEGDTDRLIITKTEETGDNTRKTVRDQDIPTLSKEIVVDVKSKEEEEWIDILSTTEQIEEYVEATVALDNAIKEVTITDEKITMKYKHPAKLFGFINVDYTMSASVDEQGVKVEYPWWVRFSKSSAKDLKTELEKELSDDAQLSNIDLQNNKKKIIQTLSDIMKK